MLILHLSQFSLSVLQWLLHQSKVPKQHVPIILKNLFTYKSGMLHYATPNDILLLQGIPELSVSLRARLISGATTYSIAELPAYKTAFQKPGEVEYWLAKVREQFGGGFVLHWIVFFAEFAPF